MGEHTCEHSGITFKTKDHDIEKLIQMNQRLNLVLGYSMGFITPPLSNSTDDETYLKYKWLCEAIENLLYLDKPLPRMP